MARPGALTDTLEVHRILPPFQHPAAPPPLYRTQRYRTGQHTRAAQGPRTMAPAQGLRTKLCTKTPEQACKRPVQGFLKEIQHPYNHQTSLQSTPHKQTMGNKVSDQPASQAQASHAHHGRKPTSMGNADRRQWTRKPTSMGTRTDVHGDTDRRQLGRGPTSMRTRTDVNGHPNRRQWGRGPTSMRTGPTSMGVNGRKS